MRWRVDIVKKGTRKKTRKEKEKNILIKKAGNTEQVKLISENGNFIFNYHRINMAWCCQCM